MSIRYKYFKPTKKNPALVRSKFHETTNTLLALRLPLLQEFFNVRIPGDVTLFWDQNDSSFAQLKL